MVHTTPDRALAVASAAAPRPGIWPLCKPIEDLLTAGAWRNPFLDGPFPDPPKSPRITIYNG